MSKLVVKGLYKIFGPNPKRGIKLIKEGLGKEEILKKTGLTVGINDANFEVKEGETFVIMGLSGSGKSTVIRCLNRLIEPTAGEILLDGNDILKMDKNKLMEVRRTSMSMVFQNFALLPNRTVQANTEYGLEVQGIDKKTREEKARQALELVGLKGYEASFPDQLSGGMKQRVGLARALANDPDILLMDEAFSALDPLIRSDMQDELIDLQQKMQKTIIFITHDLDEALKLGDRIMLMKDGKTAQIGTAEEILTNPADEYVRRFVQSVNRSEILTAADIMVKPWTTISVNQGPRLALKECKKYGLETLMVVKEGRKLVGTVSVLDITKAIDDGLTTLHSIVKENEINKVAPEQNVKDLIELTLQSSIPVAVVDPEDKLLGVIIKSSVLGALMPERGDDDA
ncbi:quaternary amine ABC transporter ATP-binding protein [Dethiobacter alkaliphilus]|uniref:quaternary amine ABC transporter ATP-binding protein n=1 Tax=Dethiobacter alkaliphilus TaxID=427926 RepID=UPI002227C46B|nr:glycine betaine/L-proline ABC transporter ATP-binding protein [Dethiobacter alkaliphilus]MCW3490879.1 glycine betaine/L-proline ABC transporter ATP-binding protein [Dethiobacter alkaliphilus]